MLRIGSLFVLTVVVAGCANVPGTRKSLVFLTREGCANTAAMRANLDQALQALGLPRDYQVLDLASLPVTDVRRGYPTPTLLYANRDVFGMAEPRPPLPEPT